VPRDSSSAVLFAILLVAMDIRVLDLSAGEAALLDTMLVELCA